MPQQLQTTEMPWDQSAFEKFKAGWSWLRTIQDRRQLKKIFNLAADSSTLKQALAWANTHGIKFFIDRTAVNCGGYYTPGTGVVAIARVEAMITARAAAVIAHEIRHAWQDYHGLLGGLNWEMTPDFAKNFIQLSLIEADAYTVGERAASEYVFTRLYNDLKKLKQPMPADYTLRAEITALKSEFLNWFFKKPKSYGDAASKYLGEKMGVYSGPPPARNFEFASDLPALGTGIDTSNPADILRLGKSFSGVNYLKAFPHDLLPRTILSPSLAASFYNAANDNQKKLTAELRKCYLRQKLSSALQKRARGLRP